MHISELPREQFEGFEIYFSYESKAYYDFKMSSTAVKENYRNIKGIRIIICPATEYGSIYLMLIKSYRYSIHRNPCIFRYIDYSSVQAKQNPFFSRLFLNLP